MFCPLCGENLEGVDTERWERDNKPNGYRCSGCSQGWEIILCNGSLIVSEAASYSKPELSLIVSDECVSA